jgi:hypothetical protein
VQISDFTALYDKGYHTGTEFDYAHKQGVDVIVAFPEVASHAPDLAFDVEHFDYNKELDQYTCPAGQTLATNGRWYNKASGKTRNRMKHYITNKCLSCPLFSRCTTNKIGRLIERSEHMDLIEANKEKTERKLETLSKATSHCGTPFWSNKETMGLLLHYLPRRINIQRGDKKNHKTCSSGCWNDIHSLQSTQNL